MTQIANAELLALECERRIMDRAHDDSVQVAAYITWVFDGNDPTKLPDNQSWWENPVSSFAQLIVNTYRRTQDKVPVPFAPRNRGFNLFDALSDGQWHEARDLSSLISGQQVTTYLKPRYLEAHGWLLEKRSGPPVAYRMTKVEA